MMIRLLFFVMLILFSPAWAADTQWKDEFVTVYTDADSELYGLATARIPASASVYKFGKGHTLWINGQEGFLTAVTASTELKASLDGLLTNQRSITIGGRELLRVTKDSKGQELIHKMYVYREIERGIYIGFTLEKPTEQIFKMIDAVYKKEPLIGAIVKRHYEQNYVIRIIQADNFFTKQDPPGLLDAMFAATLIGEKEQQLLGIHDGNDYLAPLREFYQSNKDYDILIDQFKDDLQTGQA